MDPADIENRFAFHAATTEEKRDAHTSIRQQCRALADEMNGQLPEGREKAVVMTKLEEVMFWANAALARSRDIAVEEVRPAHQAMGGWDPAPPLEDRPGTVEPTAGSLGLA